MPIFEAPKNFGNRDLNQPTVFLAGSIEMGKAIDWQQRCTGVLSPKYNVLNPRRKDWDINWTQDINNEQFRQQVEWELEGLEAADYIILFLPAGTKSTISLLEFGLYAKEKKLLVICEENFWRKGNIDVVCKRYNIPQYNTLEEALEHLNVQLNS